MYEIADRRRLRAIVEEHGLVLNGPLYAAITLELLRTERISYGDVELARDRVRACVKGRTGLPECLILLDLIQEGATSWRETYAACERLAQKGALRS